MGEIADAILNGDMTEDGEWVGTDLGFPLSFLPGEEGKSKRYQNPPNKGKVDCRLCPERRRKNDRL